MKDLIIKYDGENAVTFKIASVYEKIYEADGKEESVILTPEEVSELLDYMQYVAWYMNPPKK